MRNGEDWSAETYRCAEKAIGYTFVNKPLLKLCFTHKSYSNAFGGENNERLEFLGDSVLQLVVSDELYRKNTANEGKLTEIRKEYVSRRPLEEASGKAGLMQFLRYSGGENNIHGKTESNLFEAVCAAIYLDGGLDPVREFVKRYLLPVDLEDYKKLLQELVQEKAKRLPEYFCGEKENGFSCVVSALGLNADGHGENKQTAEQRAAKALYQILIKRTSD